MLVAYDGRAVMVLLDRKPPSLGFGLQRKVVIGKRARANDDEGRRTDVQAAGR